MIAQRVENSKTLSQLKLREILKEYGEFPEKYRTFIWKTVLKLPENFEAYAALLDKGIHPAYADIQKVYPIRYDDMYRPILYVIWVFYAVEQTSQVQNLMQAFYCSPLNIRFSSEMQKALVLPLQNDHIHLSSYSILLTTCFDTLYG